MTNDDDKDALEAAKKARSPKDSYRIHIPTKPCTFCLGTGLKSLNDRHNPNSIDCPGCNGTGERPALKCPNPDCHKGVIHYGSDADGWEHFQCETCHGTGEMP